MSRKRKTKTPHEHPAPVVAWAGPSFKIGGWFTARRVESFRRAGFRAWCAAQGIDGERPLREWDQHFSRFQAAPT